MTEATNAPEGTEAPEATTATTPTTAPASKESKGRQMAFIEREDGTFAVEFGPGLEPLTFSPSSLPENLIPLALADGIMYRLRTATSKLAGESRTPAALRSAIEAGIQAIFVEGTWKVEREAGDGLGSISQEAEAAWVFRQKRAIAAGQPVESVGTVQQAAKDFAALSDEQKKALKAQPVYKAALAEIRAKHAAANAAKLAAAAAKESANADPAALF